MGRLPTGSKEKLIETAIELILRHSYGSVSVDEICKKAGVKKGSFYHYFPSKLDLAAEAMENCYESCGPRYNEIFSPARPPRERFEMLADYKIEQQEEVLRDYGLVCGCPFATIGSELAGLEEVIRKKSDDIFSRHLLYFENALRDLVSEGSLDASTDIKAKAEEISAYILGQLTMARIQNSLDSLKKQLKPGMLRVIGLPSHIEPREAVRETV